MEAARGTELSTGKHLLGDEGKVRLSAHRWANICAAVERPPSRPSSVWLI